MNELVMIVARFFQSWYYSAFLVLFILAFIGRALIVQVIMKKCLSKTRQEQEEENGSQEINVFPSEGIISQRTLTKSYKL